MAEDSIDSTDDSCSLTLPSIPEPKLSAPTVASSHDDDGVSTIATDDISCSLTLPSIKSTSNDMLPKLTEASTAAEDHILPKDVITATKPPVNDAQPQASEISSPASQPAKTSRECQIKSPKTPKQTNVKDKVSSLPDFLSAKKNGDLGDSCSMFSTKTDPAGNTNKRTSAKKESDGSLPTPKSPRVKVPKSPGNSPSRSSKTKPKVKKTASGFTGMSKRGTSSKESVHSKITDDASFIRTLKQVGLSLPPVVVMGDTGTGKSSLVSALCNITLPKVPTQCPVQIQMKPASDRKARVSVEWKSHIVANQYPEYTTVTTANWDDLTETIHAALEFILEHCHKQITKDTVVVDLEGPTCSDLTMIDLPGSSVDHDEILRSEMAQIHHDYLPRSVILAVHSAHCDWQTSPVIADALALDPEGRHTIHCLTKPDLLDAHVEITNLLNSDHLEIQHMHAVKLGGEIDEDLNYLQTKDPDGKQNWFGTVKLHERVGSLQIDLMREVLPSMKQKTIEKREAVALQLSQMGKPYISDNDRRAFYENTCKAIVTAVEASLSGKGKFTGRSAASRLHEDCASFRDRILEGTLATVQTVKEGSFVLVSGRHDVVHGEVVHIDMEKGFACVDYVDDNGKRNKTLFDKVDMKAPEDIDENDVWAAGNRIFIGRTNNVYDALRKIPLATIRTDPFWLKKRMANTATDDLPCFLNSESFKSILTECIEEDWRPPALRLLDLVQVSVSDTISQAIRAHDSKRHKDLLALLANRSELVLQELLSSAHKQIQHHLEDEKHPLTQDNNFYTELATRKQNALKQRLLAAIKLSEDQLCDFTAVKGIVDDVFTKQSHRLGSDMLADEMESILSSYGTFAAKRIIDRTPQICWSIFRMIPSSLTVAFEEVSTKALASCFSGEQQFITKQMELSDKLQDLDEIIELYQQLLS